MKDRKSSGRRNLCALLAVAALGACNVPVHAAGGGTWNNITSINDLWSTGTNWSTGNQPGAADAAAFNLANTYSVVLPAAGGTAASVAVTGGNVSFDLSTETLAIAGTSAAGRLSVGSGAGTTATATFTNGTVTVAGDRMNIGESGTGTLNLQSGASVTVTSGLIAIGGGGSGGGTGTLSLDGVGTSLTTSTEFDVARGGTVGASNGIVNLTNGGIINGGCIRR